MRFRLGFYGVPTTPRIFDAVLDYKVDNAILRNPNMSREEELRQILLEIIRDGILTCRINGWGGNAANCAIEADHIHNLPDLVLNLSLEYLTYYYDVSRAVYMKETPAAARFSKQWERLGAILEEMRAEQPTPSPTPSAKT